MIRIPIITLEGFHYIRGDKIEEELITLREIFPDSCFTKFRLVKLTIDEFNWVVSHSDKQLIYLAYSGYRYLPGRPVPLQKAKEIYPDLASHELVVKIAVSSHQIVRPSLIEPVLSFQ